MLTAMQQEMMGVYIIAPIYTSDFYTNLLKKGPVRFSTIGDTISFDQVEKKVRKAKILPRNVEFTAPKQDGFTRESVTPDIIKDSQYFTDISGLMMQPGENKTVINGKLVDRKEAARAQRIQQIKHNIAATKEEISAEMLFKQRYSPELGKPLQFKAATVTNKDGSTIKDFLIFVNTCMTEYQKKNGVYPNLIGLGADIFTRLTKIYQGILNNIYNASVQSTQDSNGVVMSIQIGNRVFYQLPECTDAKGEAINISDLMLLYHDNAIVPGYVGITNVVNGQAVREETEVLIRETSANEKTGEAETLGESGYVPVLVNPNMIQFYKFINIDQIGA